MPRRTARTQRMHAHLGALTSDRRKVAERRLVHGHRGRGAPLRSNRDRGRRDRPRRPQSSVKPRAVRSRSRHRAVRSRFTRRSRSDAWCTGTEEEELRCEAAEIGEGVTALAVLSRVSSLAQSAAGPDIAQCEADSLAKISAQQPDGSRGRAKRRALDALIFL